MSKPLPEKTTSARYAQAQKDAAIYYGRSEEDHGSDFVSGFIVGAIWQMERDAKLVDGVIEKCAGAELVGYRMWLREARDEIREQE